MYIYKYLHLGIYRQPCSGENDHFEPKTPSTFCLLLFSQVRIRTIVSKYV